MTQTTPSHSQAVEAADIRIVPLAHCIAVRRGNEVLASFVGPECQQHAELFVSAITSQQEVAAEVGIKYVPVSDKLRDADWNHPNDDEPRGPELRQALKDRGDDKGQGLDGYWKWGFCAGFNAASRAPAPVKAEEAMRHDYPILQQFHSKHALGTLAAPSCLCCGKSTQGVEIGVRHLELPGIVICKPCKDAASRVPVASLASPLEVAPVLDAELREALRRIQYEAVSLADAQVIALEALSITRAQGVEAVGAVPENWCGHTYAVIHFCKCGEPRNHTDKPVTAPPSSKTQDDLAGAGVEVWIALTDRKPAIGEWIKAKHEKYTCWQQYYPAAPDSDTLTHWQPTAQPKAPAPVPVVQGEAVFQGPKKWTPDEIAQGHMGIRWINLGGVGGTPTLHDVREYIQRRGDEILCECNDCLKFITPANMAAGAGGDVWANYPLLMTPPSGSMFATLTPEQAKDSSGRGVPTDAERDSFHSGSGDRDRVQVRPVVEIIATEQSGTEWALAVRSVHDMGGKTVIYVHFPEVTNLASQQGVEDALNVKRYQSLRKWLCTTGDEGEILQQVFFDAGYNTEPPTEDVFDGLIDAAILSSTVGRVE